jgi:HlyD family secretion protein
MESQGGRVALDHVRTLFGVGTAAALSDDQLVERFLRRGEVAEVAFVALVEKHGPMVLRVCRDVLRDPHDAEDAFQATFLILVLKAGTIREHSSVASWLFGTARRVAIRARSRIARRAVNESRWMATAEHRPQAAAPPALLPEVHEEVDRLPEKYRTPIILCYLEGQTHEEAADQLRVPVGTVKVRLARARERLRGRLTRRGLAPAFLALTPPGTATRMTPAPFIESTIEAAMRIAEGRWSGASATVLALVQGVLRAMFLTKLKTAALVLATSLTITLAAMLGLPSLARSSQDPKSKAAGPATGGDVREVAIETIARSDFRFSTTQAATIQAFESADIYPRVAGDLKSLTVDIGDAVKRGQLLVEVDSPELDADVERERAAYQKAKARVAVAKSAIRVAEASLAAERAKVVVVESSVRESEDVLRLQQKQLDRIRELVGRNAIEPKLADETQGRFEAAASAVQVAKAQVISATAASAMAEAKLGEARAALDEVTADIGIGEATLRKAVVRQNSARITSPVDGIVTMRSHHAGVYVRPGTEGNVAPLLSIVNAGKVRVVVAVPDRDAPKLDRGDLATIRIDALGGREYRGVISRTAFAEDPASRTLRAEIDLENADGRLRPGQYGSATITLEEHPGVLTIPSSAIVDRRPDSVATCYRVSDGRAALARIKIGDDNGSRVEVIDGLKEGDSVIVGPDGKIADGDPVKSAAKVQAKRD